MDQCHQDTTFDLTSTDSLVCCRNGFNWVQANCLALLHKGIQRVYLLAGRNRYWRSCSTGAPLLSKLCSVYLEWPQNRAVEFKLGTRKFKARQRLVLQVSQKTFGGKWINWFNGRRSRRWSIRICWSWKTKVLLVHTGSFHNGWSCCRRCWFGSWGRNWSGGQHGTSKDIVDRCSRRCGSWCHIKGHHVQQINFSCRSWWRSRCRRYWRSCNWRCRSWNRS
mmetsp:Transcript_42582/g.103001  ORF Transcript_42582/g.103001 Transcript_42582/m.103001 type:complete len:221 (-) Transcript_42582:2584-3246(-)